MATEPNESSLAPDCVSGFDPILRVWSVYCHQGSGSLWSPGRCWGALSSEGIGRLVVVAARLRWNVDGHLGGFVPYVATDLDAFDDAQAVAGSTGLPFQHVLGGLACVWRWCWRQKADRVSAEQLAALFGGPATPTLPVALVAFGFLEDLGANAYRVRGVDRYLRLSEARRRGGLAAKGNLVPGARQRRKSLGTSPEAAQRVPGTSSGSDSALSAKVEGRRSKVEQKNLAGSADADPLAGEDDAYKVLAADLYAAFKAERGADLDPSGKDWAALKGLRKKHAPEEILRRWRIGLQARYAARCSTFWDLGQRWNACAAPEASQGPSRGNSGADPDQGIIRGTYDYDKARREQEARAEQEEVRRRLEALNG